MIVYVSQPPLRPRPRLVPPLPPRLEKTETDPAATTVDRDCHGHSPLPPINNASFLVIPFFAAVAALTLALLFIFRVAGWHPRLRCHPAFARAALRREVRDDDPYVLWFALNPGAEPGLEHPNIPLLFPPAPPPDTEGENASLLFIVVFIFTAPTAAAEEEEE